MRWADRVVSTDVTSETWGKDDQTGDTAAELSTETELYTVNVFLSVRLVGRGITLLSVMCPVDVEVFRGSRLLETL